MEKLEIHEHDVLVIGAGGAGLRARGGPREATALRAAHRDQPNGRKTGSWMTPIEHILT